ncbi:hypothetical protein BaRGS_00024705 [Batillaria attramentaria]|uniref:B box-type domain-containing protein n=1 Tax=Batillaria attramentaria TaxID=370345 RepID=A0ABD0KAH5_9CAEN|nr:hypothetical protein BaRGS_008855 [Batillaria attramentaria]
MGGEMCDDHPDEKLRFVCVVCDKLICRDCKLTEHEGHKTIDISKARAGLREKLERHKERLEQRLTVLENVAREVEEDRSTASRVEGEVEKEIHHRVAVVTGWIQEVEAEAMEALRTTTIKTETSFNSTTTDLDKRRKTFKEMVEEVSTMLSNLDDQDSNSNPIEALRLEQDMRTGRGSGEKLELLTEGLPTYSVRPFLRKEKSCLTADAVRLFVGAPVFTQVSKMTPKVALSPVFRCAHASGARVTAICPMLDGTVWVAHDVTAGEDEQQRVALYSAKGKPLREQKVRGRVNIVRVSHDWVFVGGDHVQKVMNAHETRDIVTERLDEHHVPKGGSLKAMKPAEKHNVFSKLDIRFSIKSAQSGERSVCTVEARNMPLLWIVGTSSFTIKVQRPLAMDADSSGQFFAVVDADPSVRLYRLSHTEPVSVYKPTHEECFSPTDVCFHVLDGKEVLLVADWANNAIHVLDFREKFRFIGYLGAGCPLLAEPTAITKDDGDRLWIGCKGGQLLTCLSADDVLHDSDEEARDEGLHVSD